MEGINLEERTPKRLSIKQKLMILSRRDRMGRLKPTALRITAAFLMLLLCTVIINNTLALGYSTAGETALSKSENEVQLSFVGDICLGRYVEDYAELYGYSQIFDKADVLWSNSDAVFANLESAVITDASKVEESDKNIHISSTEASVKSAQLSGVTAVSIANNHSMDYMSTGMEQELAVLNNIDLTYAGGGLNAEEAAEYKVIEANGLKIGFVAFSDVIPKESAAHVDSAGIATSNNSAIYQNIRLAAEETDLVVVYAHWGEENQISRNDEQQEIAHRLIESGADIVIGSHPHVLQSIETYKDGIIFYSLGNFIFDQGTRDSRSTAMAQVNINKETGDAEFVVTPMRINDLTPQSTHSSFYVKQIDNALTTSADASSYTVDSDGKIHISLEDVIDPESLDDRESEKKSYTITYTFNTN